MERKKPTAWTVILKESGKIMDDGIDDKKGNMLVLYPVFRRKNDAISYYKETYGKDKQFKIVKVLLELKISS